MPARIWLPLAALALGIGSGIAFGQVDPKPAEAKPVEPKIDTEGVSFDTADGVTIQGTLYAPIFDEKTRITAAKDAANAPVVILLHSYMADPNKGDWDGLAKTLAARGFHVLRFDFRGHGKSTVINEKVFWANRYANSAYFPKLASKKPLPNKLDSGEFKNAVQNYLPVLVNDIVAARVFLDKKNDQGTLSTSSVYLIGATDAAANGMLYLTAEETRPQKVTEFEAKRLTDLPAPQNAFSFEPRTSCGKDIAAAIWLSPKRPSPYSEQIFKDWAKVFPDLRDFNPVYCIQGDGDADSTKVSRSIVDGMLVAKPSSKTINELKFTGSVQVSKTKAVGVDLLGKQLSTEKLILDYLQKIEGDRKVVTKTNNRNFNDAPYVNLGLFGLNK